MKALLAAASPRTRVSLQVAAVLLLGLLLRLWGTASRPLNYDETCNVRVAREVLRVTEIAPLREEGEGPIVALSTPLMGYEHPLLSVYLTRLGAGVLGWSPLGVRLPHVLLGAATTVLIYWLTSRAFGRATGLLAMYLSAVDRFHIGWSRTVQPQSVLLFMAALCLWLFWRAVESGSGRRMVLVGVAVGMAYLAKEEAILLLPVFFLFLLVSPRHRYWLRRKEPYLALALTLVIGSVDAFRLLQAKPDMNLDYYLTGIFSGGFSLCPVKFFLGDLFPQEPSAPLGGCSILLMQKTYARLVMPWVMGVVCLAAVAWSLRDWSDEVVRLLLIAFFVVFAFFMFGFTMAEEVNPYWHASLCWIPAIVLAARVLADASRRWAWLGSAVVAALLLYLTADAWAVARLTTPA